VQEYARVYKSVQEYARVCERVCKSVQEYAKVCKSMQEYAMVCTVVYINILIEIQESFQDFKHVWVSAFSCCSTRV